ncbi:MAG: septal ring lytic transglycosylase RlpA family protein [Rhizomicrobium sp.]
MALRIRGYVAIAALSLGAAACSTTPAYRPVSLPPSAGIYKIGQPYQIDGTWYYPREQPEYDETGIASWYGPTFYGQQTANGELFDANALTAAHRTLPMPVNVRVTNLENGNSLVLRVNDRGPFARGRIIDVSEQAAKLLGFYGKGTARVRVTYLSRADLPGTATPPAIADALPAAPTGNVQEASLDPVPGIRVDAPVRTEPLPAPAASSQVPDADLQPDGKVTHVPVPAVTHLYIQAGAFGNLGNANRLKARLAAAHGLFISTIDRNGQRLYRVRIGPFDDVGKADAALAHVARLGGSDARIVVDR